MCPTALPNSIYHLLEALEPSPAWVLDELFDIVAANKASRLLWPELSEPIQQPNFLMQFFSAQTHSIFGQDWPAAASLAMQQRSGKATAQHLEQVFRLQIAGSQLKARFTYLNLVAPENYMLCTLTPIDAESRTLLHALVTSAHV